PANHLERVHVAGVVTKNQYRLYVDGKLAATLDVPAGREPTKDNFMIGGGPRNQVTWLGTVDEVRISKRARYDKYFTPQARFEPDADTLALYHCDEGQ